MSQEHVFIAHAGGSYKDSRNVRRKSLFPEEKQRAPLITNTFQQDYCTTIHFSIITSRSSPPHGFHLKPTDRVKQTNKQPEICV